MDAIGERPEKPSGALPWSAQPEDMRKTADPRPHLVELDALRGLGILGVVATHSLMLWYRIGTEPLTIPLLNIDMLELFQSSPSLGLGPFCLGLFFLLSGYLLTWTETSRASRGNYSLRSYALRRALRLLPAYYTALAIAFLLWPTNPTLIDTLSHLAVLQTFLPDYYNTAYDRVYWYLTSEVVFYALLPLLILKIRGLYPRLALFAVLVAMAQATEMYIYANFEALGVTHSVYLAQFPLTHLWLFMAGVLLRMLFERLEEKRLGGSRPALSFSLVAGSLVLLVLATYIPFVKDATYLHVMISDWLAISFFAGALLGSPVLSRILSWRLLGFVGVISYSLYLFHNTVIVMARAYVLRPAKPLLKHLDGAELWLAFAGYLGTVLVVAGAIAYLSYRYIESPFMRYKPK